MLGVTRFILAVLVLLSHIPQVGLKLNLGIVAVISFYFISGYLMRLSYGRFKTKSLTPIKDFYLDRALKIFPQYLIMVTASFGIIAICGPAQHVIFMDQNLSIEKYLLNIVLLPANYVFSPFVVTSMLPHPIIPPAWSLATEFHFYLLLPLIFSLSKKLFVLLLFVTASIQFGSLFFSDGVFNSDNFGYRFIFGVLTIFLFGYSYAAKADGFYLSLARTLWCLYAFFLLFAAPVLGLNSHPQVQELLLGGVLAWPTVFAALNCGVTNKRILKADKLLGNLAYPIFISHFFSFVLAEKFLGAASGNHGLFILSSVLTCFAISFILMWIQSKIEKYRISRRGFSSMVVKDISL